MQNFIVIDLQLYKTFKITRVSVLGTQCRTAKCYKKWTRLYNRSIIINNTRDIHENRANIGQKHQKWEYMPPLVS